jgi:hypothetical protein
VFHVAYKQRLDALVVGHVPYRFGIRVHSMCAGATMKLTNHGVLH